MSSLRDYLARTERQYHVRLKSVIPLDDAAMDKIERAVVKYDPIDIARPKKTILQSHPLDFSGVENAEVYVLDMVFALPVSAYVMQQEVCHALRAPEKFIIVRGDNDPLEQETDRINAQREMDAEAAKNGWRRDALLKHPDYPEAPQVDGSKYHGEGQTGPLLAYLYRLEQERIERAKVDAPNPLFRWIDMPKAETVPDTYNDHINDAPRSVPDKLSGEKKFGVSIQGNFDNEGSSYTRVYTDGKKPIVATRTPAPIRKDK